MNFLRRIGPDPHEGGFKTAAADGCPDILELEGGDFAIIGLDITAQARSRISMVPGASCGSDETIIRVPRRTLVLAKRDIPDTL
jgi:hypothetical protein